MAKAQTSKDVAIKQQAGALAVADLEADAGAGFENQSRADMVIPYLKALQGLSKEVTAKGSNVRSGMLLNSATGEAYDGDEGVLIVPAITEHVYVEYIPRDKGGGFAGRHAPNSEIVETAKARAAALNRPFGKLYTEYANDGTPVGNELIETFYVYAVVCDDMDPMGMVVLAFDSTDIKAYRKWNTGVSSFMLPRSSGQGKFNPAMFTHLVRVTTQENRYPGGSSYNFVLRPAVNNNIRESLLAGDDPRYIEGRNLRQLVADGLAKAAVDVSEKSEASGGKDTPF